MLVLRAGASDATRLTLATVGHVLTKKLSIFVIDELSLLLAELAILATRLALEILFLLIHGFYRADDSNVCVAV